jgi:putative membrane protein
MGTADLVPGISGGTVAFILGFYQQLMESIKSLNGSALCLLLSGECRQFAARVHWRFLLTLISGIVLAIALFAHPFHFLLSHSTYRIYVYGIFFGLILASSIFCLMQVKQWTIAVICACAVGLLAAFLLTGSSLTTPVEGEYAVPVEVGKTTIPLSNYDAENGILKGLSNHSLRGLLDQEVIREETPVLDARSQVIGHAGQFVSTRPTVSLNLWLISCGAIAACALLLPGVSGSYLLTILGVYPLVVEALAEFLSGIARFSFVSDSFWILASLGTGVVLGSLLFSRGISWLLKTFPDVTLALLSGFVLGAIRSVWPFWSYEYMLLPMKISKGPQLIPLDPFIPPLNSVETWVVLFFSASACALVFLLEKRASHQTV